VVNSAQVAAALRLTSVHLNSAWHKQEDGQSTFLETEGRLARKWPAPLCRYLELSVVMSGFVSTRSN
jgi:hypothetical protein